ncbi:MAG: hypothetical protein GYB31_05155 [Bacteroidetes bacterium]|nr:hypothetical protein [Bacteroidota bacterium]
MNRITLLCFALLVPLVFQAQDMQLGFNGGITIYQGDLQPSNSISLDAIGTPGASAGVFARWNHNNVFNTRLGLQYGYISAADSESIDPGRINRNLSFQTNIFELGLIEEINLVGFNPNEGMIFTPYIYFGVAAMYFNPKTEYQGELYELQPLGTEGQGLPGFDEKYSLLQVAIPFGAGLKFALSKSITLHGEVGSRKLFTDYLDDVSGFYVSDRELEAGNGILAAELAYRTDEINGIPNEYETGTQLRGGPEYDDWYIFVTVGLSFDIDASSIFGGVPEGCPTW